MKKEDTLEQQQPTGEKNVAKYEKPEIKTLKQSDVLSAVNKGSKFPARGFAG